jgi:hypothetical protein
MEFGNMAANIADDLAQNERPNIRLQSLIADLASHCRQRLHIALFGRQKRPIQISDRILSIGEDL